MDRVEHTDEFFTLLGIAAVGGALTGIATSATKHIIEK